MDAEEPDRPDDGARHLTRDYWCFISYRHLDNKAPGRQWASWLHQALETYEVPADLVGTMNSRGAAIPDRIFPVFRDEEELSTDAELSRPIEAALRSSRFLVVICSPNAVASRFVNNEILRFRQLGKGHCILAVIIAGEPNADDDSGDRIAGRECFPPALRHRLDSDGRLTTELIEPLAADFRLPDGSEGWTSPVAHREALVADKIAGNIIKSRVEEYAKQSQLMLLKVVAGVLDVPLGVLTKRDKAYQLELQRRRAKVLRRWLASVSFLAVAAIVATFVAVMQMKVAEGERIKAEESFKDAQRAVDDLFTRVSEEMLLKAPGMQDLRKELLGKTREYYRQFLKQRAGDPALQDELSLTMFRIGLVEELESPPNALDYHREAKRIQTELLAATPDDETRLRRLSDTTNALGRTYHAQRKVQDADREYAEAARLREKLAKQFPNDGEYRRLWANAIMNLGTVRMDYGRFEEAALLLQQSQQMRQELLVQSPRGKELKRDLARGYFNLGMLADAQRQLAEAEACYRRSVDVWKELAAPEEGDFEAQLNLASAYRSLAYTRATPEQMLDDFVEAERALDRLFALNSKVEEYRGNLGAVLTDKAVAQNELGEDAAARQSIDRAVELLGKLVRDNPKPSFRFDLGVAYRERGVLRRRTGDVTGGIVDLRESLDIFERLVAEHPEDGRFEVQRIKTVSEIAAPDRPVE